MAKLGSPYFWQGMYEKNVFFKYVLGLNILQLNTIKEFCQFSKEILLFCA